MQIVSIPKPITLVHISFKLDTQSQFQWLPQKPHQIPQSAERLINRTHIHTTMMPANELSSVIVFDLVHIPNFIQVERVDSKFYHVTGGDINYYDRMAGSMIHTEYYTIISSSVS